MPPYIRTKIKKPLVRLSWPGRVEPPFNRQPDTLRTVLRFPGNPEASAAFENLLIRGDNRSVMAALQSDPWVTSIQKAGGLKLVYIDPPFRVGIEFKRQIRFGSSLPERTVDDVAYSDSWGAEGVEWLEQLWETFHLIHTLLAADGVLFVHVDQRMHPAVRMMLDEVFGADHLVNDIVWHYRSGGGATQSFGRKHDNIVYYQKGTTHTFNLDTVRVPYDAIIAPKRSEDFHPDGKVSPDVWDISRPPNHSHEWLGYPTQKPEVLLERIIKVATNPGDLIADFFAGSGTTLAVAEKLGRRWIGCDLGLASHQVCRHRMHSLGSKFQTLETKEQKPGGTLQYRIDTTPESTIHLTGYTPVATIPHLPKTSSKSQPVLNDEGQLIRHTANKPDEILTDHWSDFLESWWIEIETNEGPIIQTFQTRDPQTNILPLSAPLPKAPHKIGATDLFGNPVLT